MEAVMTKAFCGGRRRLGAVAAQAIGMALAAIVLGMLWTMAPASAAAPTAKDKQCLSCHGLPGLAKQLSDGQTLSLHVDATHFADSVHAPLGCGGCHSDIDLASHPSAARVIPSRQAFAVSMSQQICATCHTKEFQQWGQSVHAALVRQGDAHAPVCSNCHSPHTMTRGEASSMATVPCRSCHAVIYAAYATSVHGILRTQGVAEAPLCFNCHRAHDVAVPSALEGLAPVCLSCHKEAVETHRTWLPDVDLHFKVVACSACHTPQAHRVVALVLYSNQMQKEISEPEGIPEFENFTLPPTAQRPGLDAATLMALLATLSNDGIAGKTAILGRLEVATGAETHQLSFAAKAIHDCAVCHRKGAAAFQSVKVVVAGPAGIPINYNATNAVLTSVFTIPAIGGFYVIGGTRIGFLDVAFVLALAVGIGWSILHLIVRWGVRRFAPDTHPEQPKG
jgi:predicted CXXCH cytochrome family protein